jgi:hypothetical protein
MHEFDIEERKSAFQDVWRRKFVDDVSRMPPNLQGMIHELVKRAFNAGTNWERRKSEPMQLGGCD